MPRQIQPEPLTVSAGVPAAALRANSLGASAATILVPAGSSEIREDCTVMGLLAAQTCVAVKPLSALVVNTPPRLLESTITVSPQAAVPSLVWKLSPA